jgi:cAMP-dependent protein kinase regulator
VEEQVLADFPGVNDPVVRDALASAETQQYQAGDVIIREGDPADAFYVILHGTADVTRHVDQVEQTLTTLGEGEYFGEIGLLQDIPRTATVTAGPEGVEVLVLLKAAFQRVVAASDLISEDLARIVRKRIASRRLLEAWPSLSPESIERVMSGFSTKTYAPGEVIIREGDSAEHFFILFEGEVVVSRESRLGVDEEIARLGPGEYFGEMGLLYRGPRRATVTACASAPATVLMTDQKGFQGLLGQAGGMRAEFARSMMSRVKQLVLHRF